MDKLQRQFAGAQILGTREHQEDAYAWLHECGADIAIVADGLGGHLYGDVASRLVVSACMEYFITRAEATYLPPETLLRGAVDAAQDALRVAIERLRRFSDFGTTLSILFVRDGQFHTAIVGDSPVYLLREGRISRLRPITTYGDYDAAALVVDRELRPLIQISEGEALEPGDRFLIASDGIHSLEDPCIGQHLMKAATPGDAVRAVLRDVEARGYSKQDNATVIAAFPEESGR